MIGKKGMSPLIATILLMAFAVALGGMIMNWSSQLPDLSTSCSNVKITIQKFCLLDNNKIMLDIRNTGNIDISAVKLKINDPPIITENNIDNSAINKGEELNVMVPFANSRESKVDLIIGLGEDKTFCSEPLISKQLPDC